MEIREEIQVDFRNLAVIQQDGDVFLLSDDYEIMMNLEYGNIEIICTNNQVESLLNLAPGDVIGRQNIKLSEDTVNWLGQYQISNPQPHPLVSTRYKLEKLPYTDWYRTKDMKHWHEGEIKYLHHIHADPRHIWQVSGRMPDLWKLEVNGKEQGTLITREDPIIIQWKDYCYIFSIHWDLTLRVYRCALTA